MLSFRAPRIKRSWVTTHGVVALLATAVLAPSCVNAQRRVGYSADVGIGLGTGNGGRAFRDRDFIQYHFALDVRRKATKRWAVFGELLAVRNLLFGHSADCLIDPRGGCIPFYPDLSGFAATIGAVFAPWQPITLRIGAGPGRLGSEGTNVTALVTQADIALMLTEHGGLIYGFRGNDVADFNGERLAKRLYYLGLRLR